jgi:DNA repair photolyase
MNQELPVVISASRRTDLVGCYPDYLIEKLKAYPPENVHTIVIWTKNPANMILHQALRQRLSQYVQVYIHLTITGLGASALEPGIPPWERVVEMIPELVQLVKGPERISWRFDPIIAAEDCTGQIENFSLFPAMAERVRKHGINTCRTSWASPYKKVIRRMQKKGFTLRTCSPEEQASQERGLEKVAGSLGMKMFYCSMEGFERSRCIDGALLTELHPQGLSCSLKRAKGQRPACGCTESIDIGWYSLKCTHGCIYCYAEPQIGDMQKIFDKKIEVC